MRNVKQSIALDWF